MRLQDGSNKGTASVHQILCKSRKKCNGGESISHMRVFEWHVQTHQAQKGKIGEEKNQEHAHYFLTSRGLFTKKNSPGRSNGQFHILL
jgi:hypothetical protein